MVEQCHRTIESILKKVMEKQENWVTSLDSILLGMRLQVHSSTGYLPICMLYNKDPIMPFQMANSMKHSNVSLVTNNVDYKETSCEVNSMKS